MDSSGLLDAWRLGILDRLIGSKTVTLIFYELGNVFWKMEKRDPEVWNSENFFKLLEYLKRGFHIMEPDYHSVLSVAKETGLTFYDAAYLWLARKENEPILTLDSDFEDLHPVLTPENLLHS